VTRSSRFWGTAIYVLAGAIGLLAFVYPFWRPDLAQVTGQGAARGQDAPLILALLVGLCVAALVVEVQGRQASAKVVAALGVLIAIASVLRFLEVVVPLPGGFSPIFAPILLVGYVFGARFGFLMGALTLLVSGLLTGNVGPWLPFQMFAAGWMGLSAGWLPHIPVPRRWPWPYITPDVLLLTVVGAGWGVLYGMVMNIYFWPFVSGNPEQFWQPGTGWMDTVRRYLLFYATTSLLWDLVRAAGNALLVLVLGAPVVRALERFQRRFEFEVA
jgi:energy-coupling factor transport system substrate-specific component